MHLPKSERTLLGKGDCSKTHIQKSGRRNRRENVRYPHAAHSVRKTYVFVRLAGDVLWIRQGCTLQSPRKVVYPMRSDSIFVGPLAKSNEFHKPMLQPCSSLEQGWSIGFHALSGFSEFDGFNRFPWISMVSMHSADSVGLMDSIDFHGFRWLPCIQWIQWI